MMRWILLPVEATHFVRLFRIPRLRGRPFILQHQFRVLRCFDPGDAGARCRLIHSNVRHDGPYCLERTVSKNASTTPSSSCHRLGRGDTLVRITMHSNNTVKTQDLRARCSEAGQALLTTVCTAVKQTDQPELSRLFNPPPMLAEKAERVLGHTAGVWGLSRDLGHATGRM